MVTNYVNLQPVAVNNSSYKLVQLLVVTTRIIPSLRERRAWEINKTQVPYHRYIYISLYRIFIWCATCVCIGGKGSTAIPLLSWRDANANFSWVQACGESRMHTHTHTYIYIYIYIYVIYKCTYVCTCVHVYLRNASMVKGVVSPFTLDNTRPWV